MIAIVFPGQGSQKPGMGKDLAQTHHQAGEIFETVGSAIDQDVRDLCWASDEDTLRLTQNAQIALYTVGLSAWESLRAHLPNSVLEKVRAMAGHSVGEYAALAGAGLFSIDDGARLVALRGKLMAESGSKQPGTMAAVLGLGREELEDVCTEVNGVVVIANDNCPGQLVISGEVDAVGQASQLASQRGAKRVLPLNVSGAFHSPLMQEAASEMGVALSSLSVRSPQYDVYANVSAEAVDNPERWPSLLERQLESPVKWTETIEHMIRDGVDTFVECGVGEVLCGLIKRTSKEARTLSVSDDASLRNALRELGA